VLLAIANSERVTRVLLSQHCRRTYLESSRANSAIQASCESACCEPERGERTRNSTVQTLPKPCVRTGAVKRIEASVAGALELLPQWLWSDRLTVELTRWPGRYVPTEKARTMCCTPSPQKDLGSVVTFSFGPGEHRRSSGRGVDFSVPSLRRCKNSGA
jgi:hypothetical protein